ncbi:hypothetical protein EZV62_013662 [Acer yangbiense]|uniref:ER membrane protein complex subunit 4 n=1 Tax=Acer yangbiense TaxID=1000413 RepID=A0A5C7I007_9ROSI|nr:hypothetical protein EZV62_013662 [Acer yangbiense]
MEKGKGVMGSGRRWAVDFTDNSTAHISRDIPDPLGFTRASQDQDDSTMSRQKKDAEANWKSQKAWEVAQAPFKNLLMMGFMMWMAGSTVHLFSIGITFSALWQPISALQGVGKVFEPYKDSKVDLNGPKLLFIALNLGGLALGVWKLNTLGLLPTHASDWVSSLPPAQEVEYSVFFLRAVANSEAAVKKRKRESMEELQVVELAATYLKKKGFGEAENTLQAQIQRSNSSNNNAVYNALRNNAVHVHNGPGISKFCCSFSFLSMSGQKKDAEANWKSQVSKSESKNVTYTVKECSFALSRTRLTVEIFTKWNMFLTELDLLTNSCYEIDLKELLMNVVSFIVYEQIAWEAAQALFMNLPILGFMMWMAGGMVHHFNTGITFSALWQPISFLQGVGNGFKKKAMPWTATAQNMQRRRRPADMTSHVNDVPGHVTECNDAVSSCLIFGLIRGRMDLLMDRVGDPSLLRTLEDLSFNFYAVSCPAAEFMVKNTVRSASSDDPTIPGKLLRLLFHDCFVEGCDASVMIQGNGTERSDPANASLGGFSVIDSAKRVLEVFCPGTVSCADILALAARDAVEIVRFFALKFTVFMFLPRFIPLTKTWKQTGGPALQIPTGRRDGRVSESANVRPNVVDTSFTMKEMIKIFSSKGLSLEDLVTLSGAHTIGSAHCSAFSDRFQEDSKGKFTPVDTSLDTTYADELMKKCPADASPSVTVDNDPQTSFVFDNQYYRNLLAHKGLFQSDSVLLDDNRTRKPVEGFANDQVSFFRSWGQSFVKLTSIGVKTGEEGEIRQTCSVTNG